MIIGAGIGGLVSAVLLASRGLEVTVLEKEAGAGGKVRQLDLDGAKVDAGPTVFTMRNVVDDIFAAAGAKTENYVTLHKADRIARHAWDGETRLDLFADHARSKEAIGEFAGAKAAVGFESFSKEARRIFDILDRPFLQNSKTYPPGLMWRIGLWRVGALIAIRPYESLWKVLKEHFDDLRLLQLFGRYTTYCGSSPFQTPATLMLIAHVEAQGVWAIDGGMSALAAGLEKLAREQGVTFRYGASVSRIDVRNKAVAGVELASGEYLAADKVIFNGDPAALASGLLGRPATAATRKMPAKARSLSALVWLANAKTGGFELDHHNVFFSSDYEAEFCDIKSGRPPASPTAYVCALDRGRSPVPAGQAERLQIIVNAPANGDTEQYASKERDRCTTDMLARLRACGLELEEPLPHRLVTPADFATLFPATGGALYGRASHGWAASFLRPGSRTSIRGLYCAGGATHPGAGVPMAALSGKLASQALLSDHISTRWFHRKAIAGGMSTRSAMMGASG
ncbi:1-hydroxycarotenoid 3,4-desaturase CrtD [Sphingorhabdus sp.]|uniref:1-hydroxycarotenoid 3,4-desaturase CrtD n=1 Tax=Sphingorhabdus sp. TaxID=1902408 RepID=UPI00391AD00B